MSGVIGKGNRSYIKQDVGDSLLPDFNVSSLVWVHEVDAATIASRRINFDMLNFPAGNALRQNGFANPASNRILALGVGNHRTNLTVETSLDKNLIDFLSYEADDTGITLDASVTPVLGESFVFTFDQNVRTGNRVVNARPLRKTAIIPAPRRRVAIGSTIEIAPSIIDSEGIDNQQIGNVQVFAEGKLLFRNPGNEPGDILTSGNYREVFLSDTTDANIESATVTLNGTANAIELNVTLTQEADFMIISTNLIVDSEANTISTLTNSATTKLNELPTLESGNAGEFLQVNADGTSYQLTGSTAHVIENQAGVEFPTRNNLQFSGVNITDDPANDRTIVAVSGAGSALQVREQTSPGTFSWICPDSVSEIRLTMTGGGGGGGGGGSANSFGLASSGGGGGAGGGFLVDATIDGLVGGETYEVIVGAAGGGGGGGVNSSGGGGGSGGTSSMRGTFYGTGNHSITCSGGGGGGAGLKGNGAGGGGGGAPSGTLSGLEFFGVIIPAVTTSGTGGAGGSAGTGNGSNGQLAPVVTLGNTTVGLGSGTSGTEAGGAGGGGGGLLSGGNAGQSDQGNDLGSGGGGGGGSFTAGGVGGTGSDSAPGFGGAGGSGGLGVIRISFIGEDTDGLIT